MFNIFLSQFFSAVPSADTIEERNEDVADIMDNNGEVFEVYESDYEHEDDKLEFLDSFV